MMQGQTQGHSQVLDGGALDVPYLRMKGRAITERDFVPSFRLALAAKDASLVRASAHEHGLDLPLLDLIARRPITPAKLLSAEAAGLSRYAPGSRQRHE